MMAAQETPLPPAFVHFRDLFRIHMKQILTLDRKLPMHAAALLVLIACEALSRLFGRVDHDIFARDLLAMRNVPYQVGREIFDTLRNHLAHEYATGRIVVGRREIRPTLFWKGHGAKHLKLVGVRRQDGKLRPVPLAQNEETYQRLAISVEELWKDFDALLRQLEADLRANPKLAATVQRNAVAAALGDTRKSRPGGTALSEWREYVRTARWEGPPRAEGG
jgi:hypothetical protein